MYHENIQPFVTWVLFFFCLRLLKACTYTYLIRCTYLLRTIYLNEVQDSEQVNVPTCTQHCYILLMEGRGSVTY